jgi:hypothetical protein
VNTAQRSARVEYWLQDLAIEPPTTSLRLHLAHPYCAFGRNFFTGFAIQDEHAMRLTRSIGPPVTARMCHRYRPTLQAQLVHVCMNPQVPGFA